MSLTILSVAYPFAAVTHDSSGGAEQVLGILDEALINAGHRSIVIAREGSCVRGQLIPSPAFALDHDRTHVWSCMRRLIDRVLAQHHVDVIHVHGLDFAHYLPSEGPPVLATLHLPTSWYDAETWTISRPRTHLHCVSPTQHEASPHRDRLLPPIENGVRIGPPWQGRRAGFATCLARICPEKNQHAAIDAAAIANVPILLAGDLFDYPAHSDYFQRELRPRLSHNARYLGHLSGRAKRRLLGSARCLLIPSLAPETSSLVAMEALALGTPVIAYRAGELSRIITDGLTGRFVSSISDMADAIRHIDAIDPARCRQEAQHRFSARRMIDAYFARYQALTEGRDSPVRLSPRREGAGLSAVRTEVITSPTRLHAIRDQWRSLHNAMSHATPFQSPAWLLPWARHLCEGTLRVIALWEGLTLRGLAPLYADNAQPTPRLLPLGISSSDHLDILSAPGWEHRTALALNQELHTALTDDSEFYWPQLPQASPLRALPGREFPADPCMVLRLDPRRPLRESLPKGIWHNLTYYRARADRAGYTLRPTTSESLDADLAALFRLHAARWQAKGSPGVLDDARVRAFLSEAAHAFHSDGLLRMAALLHAGRRVAVVLAFADPPPRANVYYYIGGFDRAHQAVSPGTLLIGHLVEQAHAAGATRFDFLRGEERYKQHWGAAPEPTHARLITRADFTSSHPAPSTIGAAA